MSAILDDRAIIGDETRGAQRVLERLVSSPTGACIFAALVYVPLLFTDPGKVEADTKSYLYLDPGRLLARAVSLWDPKIAMGTLSHQTIGYLFPMGPYFWLLDRVGVPAWVAQRLWLGTIMVAAGLGVAYLLNTLQRQRVGIAAAVLVYTFSPYVLGYAGIYSALLLPWAALPWWIGFAIRAIQRGGWRYPALFALTVQIVGSVNGSSLAFAAIGPLLWVAFSIWVLRDCTVRAGWSIVWRTGFLTVSASLWWAVPLAVEGKYGINFLQFTESLKTVATTSPPFEVLRGLGNWFFYGGDRIGFWVDTRPLLTQQSFLVFVSFLIPAAALFSGALVRWRYRSYFVLLLFVGTAICVGASPYGSPSPLGSVYKEFSLRSAAALALRNSGRAMPLVALASAALVGAGVDAVLTWLKRREPRRRSTWAFLAMFGILLTNAYPILSTQVYNSYLERGPVPDYWKRAISTLDARSNRTRVWAIPGSDFASYRWGDTRDPIEPGLMDRPFVARELIPWGSAASFNLIAALDRRIQDQSLDPRALAPMARLMGVGDVLVRSDLQTDRYSLVPANALWRYLNEAPIAGLTHPVTFGTVIPGELKFPEVGDLTASPTQDRSAPPLAIFSVKDPQEIVRLKPAKGGVILAGNGEGVIDLASADLLDPTRPILFSQSLNGTGTPKGAETAVLVLTDTNRKRAQRWFGIHSNVGYTEQAGEVPMALDPSDQRLDTFERGNDDARTVTVLEGARSIQATSWGEPVFGYSPANRPAAAFDGDIKTAWTFGGGVAIETPQRLRLALEHPITSDHINLVQFAGRLLPTSPPPQRAITDVTLRFDNKTEVHVKVNNDSRKERGQAISFPSRTFTTFEIRVDHVVDRSKLIASSKNAVGFSEIVLRDNSAKATPVRIREWAEMPRDLLAKRGRASAGQPLVVLMTRDATMDSAAMNRKFSLPTERQFLVSGEAALSPFAQDEVVDRMLGAPDATKVGGLTAFADARLGSAMTRASAAFDGDSRTAWQSPVDAPRTKIHFQVNSPITIDHLDLNLIDDGRHSHIRELQIEVDGGAKRVVSVPASSGDSAKERRAVPVSFGAITGTTFTFTIRKVDKVVLSESTMPVGVAEFGVPGVQRGALPPRFDSGCITDLLTVDGGPFGIKMSGRTEDVLKGKPMTVEPCIAAPITLRAGPHRTAAVMSPINPYAVDLYRVVLSSAPVGTVATDARHLLKVRHDAPSQISVVSETASTVTVRVEPGTAPEWLVLGQSFNAGWTATSEGRDLGAPTLIDGFANGWQLPGGRKTALTITMRWKPQESIRYMFIGSGVAVALCGVVVFRTRRSRVVAMPIAQSMLMRRAASRSDGQRSSHAATSLAATSLAASSPAGSRRRAVMVVMTIAMLGALIADLTVGAVCLVLMGASVASTRIRSYVRFVPGTIFAMIALAIPALQAVRRYPPRFAWPDFFDWARSPAWIALIMLLGNVLLDRLKIHVSDSQHATLPNHDPDARVDDGYSHSESDR